MRDGGVEKAGISDAELREAQRGFLLMLRRKRFSPQWIEENANDLLGQAASEYAEKLASGRPADNPPGWLINCAWRRAQNLLDSQRRKPRPSSLEDAFDLADEATPTPEAQTIDNDRRALLRKALGHLPDKERKLVALVYFEGFSIREAGRLLGWGKSAVDRHHRSAMERLHALVGGDRTVFSPATLLLAAWAALKGAGKRAVEVTTAPFRRAAGHLSELAGRIAPYSDTAGAAASSGAGRAAGYCAAGVLAVACGLGAAGVVGPETIGGAASVTPKIRSEHSDASRPAALPVPHPVPSSSARGQQAKAQPRQVSRSQSTPTVEASEPAPVQRSERRRTESAPAAPAATHNETEETFGIEESSSPSSAPAPARPAPAETAPAPAVPRSAPAESSKGGGGSGGSAVNEEFGL